jgi:hypothetical protein
MRSARRATTLAATFAAATIACDAALAAEWSFAPLVSSSFDYDSNRRLIEDGRSTESATVYVAAGLARESERTELAARPWARIERVQGDEGLDSDDGGLELSSVRRGERATLAVGGSWSAESTLNTELADTGLVGRDSTRETREISGSWVLSQSERRQLEAAMGFADVAYDDGGRTQLADYESRNASLGQSFQASARTRLALTLFGSEVRSAFSTSRDAGARASVWYAVSSQTDATIYAGVSERRARGVGDAGLVYGASINRRGERTSLSASIARGSEASGFGVLVDRIEANLAASRAVSPRLSAVAAIRTVRNRNLFAFAPGIERRYESIEGGLDWRGTETLTLRGRVAALRSGGNVAAEDARGARASLSLLWTPRPRSISR